VKAFSAPKETLGDLTAETAAKLVAAAADVAVIVDGSCVIQDVSFRETELLQELERHGSWTGRPWSETVTADGHPKIEALLREAASKPASSWRQLNHQSSRGNEIPVLYSAMQVRENRFVALGRDLRAVASLQQKLVEAQITMERDYARMRHVETRYRLLFQVSAEPVLILDAANQKILEANPAAVALFGGNPKRLLGRSFPTGFDAETTRRLQSLLSDAWSAGQGHHLRAQLADGNQEFLVSASLFRHDATALLLVRMSPVSGDGAAAMSETQSRLLALGERAPDGLVVTDREGRILASNQAFIDMAQLATTEQARGETLARWFGRPEIDLQVLMSNLRQNDSIRLFATVLRGEYGATAEVEISAVPLSNVSGGDFGFVIRNVGRRLAPPRVQRELPHSAEQLTELIGRVPLKDIVRETTDVIERLCIEAALNLTGDNRASAAEMLGLSRQSLYVKLRRFGLADLSEDADRQPP
jgi:transcriptional regulator PpsR